ncbi:RIBONUCLEASE H1 [Ceraceosorus bombacis]|uniref:RIBONUCLEASE H1 n=1 Tax=Ceraceosorus bombacis TaxID=401625 RepID=A0A0P1BDS7_9BASI|nr:RIBONUCLEASE H1 [Ceraceosorus bombacis]
MSFSALVCGVSEEFQSAVDQLLGYLAQRYSFTFQTLPSSTLQLMNVPVEAYPSLNDLATSHGAQLQVVCQRQQLGTSSFGRAELVQPASRGASKDRVEIGHGLPAQASLPAPDDGSRPPPEPLTRSKSRKRTRETTSDTSFAQAALAGTSRVPVLARPHYPSRQAKRSRTSNGSTSARVASPHNMGKGTRRLVDDEDFEILSISNTNSSTTSISVHGEVEASEQDTPEAEETSETKDHEDEEVVATPSSQIWELENAQFRAVPSSKARPALLRSKGVRAAGAAAERAHEQPDGSAPQSSRLAVRCAASSPQKLLTSSAQNTGTVGGATQETTAPRGLQSASTSQRCSLNSFSTQQMSCMPANEGDTAASSLRLPQLPPGHSQELAALRIQSLDVLSGTANLLHADEPRHSTNVDSTQRIPGGSSTHVATTRNPSRRFVRDRARVTAANAKKSGLSPRTLARRNAGEYELDDFVVLDSASDVSLNDEESEMEAVSPITPQAHSFGIHRVIRSAALQARPIDLSGSSAITSRAVVSSSASGSRPRDIAPLARRDPFAGTTYTLRNGRRVASHVIYDTRLSAEEWHNQMCEVYKAKEDTALAWTDGSRKQGGTASAAAVFEKFPTQLERLPNGSSALTAELHAIYMAVLTASHHSIGRLVVFSDCQAAILAVADRDENTWLKTVYWPRASDPRAENRLKATRHLINELKKTKVILIWVPGHNGVPNNEMADSAANFAGKHCPERSCCEFFGTAEELPGTSCEPAIPPSIASYPFTFTASLPRGSGGFAAIAPSNLPTPNSREHAPPGRLSTSLGAQTNSVWPSKPTQKPT